MVCMKRINFHADPGQMARLQGYATEAGGTVAEHIRRAIDAYLDDRSPDKDKTLRYKGYMAVMRFDSESDQISATGRLPIGSLHLHANSIKGIRRLFEAEVNRHLDWLKVREGKGKP